METASKQSNAKILRPSTMVEGQIVEGTYKGSFRSKNNILCHRIVDGEAETILLGTGKLNYLLDKINPGTAVKIEYKGKVKVNRGRLRGKFVHDFDVATLVR